MARHWYKPVIRNGELFHGDTLDQIWPVRRPLPTQYWWMDRPERGEARQH